jgi:hypothetical protein
MWSYSGDPKTSLKDEVRFTIGDTNQSMSQLTDEEIDFALQMSNSSVINASIKCLEAICARLAAQVDYKIGPESVNASDRYEHFKKQLDYLLKYKSQVGAPSAYIPDTPTAFDIGMHDNR